MKITFQIGPVTVQIEGDHLVTRWAERAFSHLRSDQAPDLVFRFKNTPAPEPADDSVGDEHDQVSKDEVRYRERRYDVRIRRGEPLDVELHQRDRRPLWVRSLADPEESYKMWLSHGASLDTHLLKEFAYGIAPLAMQCVLLPRRAALIHAGGLAVGDQGVLLPAWGGVGKSTVVSRTVLHGSARFISDDHAVIDSSGRMHLHLLPIHVYHYHAVQDAQLKSCMHRACSPLNRIQWKLASKLRPKRVVRWVNPADLFGPEKLAHCVQIRQVIVMFRGKSRELRWEPVNAAEAARPCAGIIFDEINGLAERLARAGAGWCPGFMPTIEQAYQTIVSTYQSAFAQAHCARLLVPRETDADTLIRFLQQQCPLVEEALRLKETTKEPGAA